MTQEECAKKAFVMLIDDNEEDTFLFKHAAKKARTDIDVSTHLDSAQLLAKLQSEAEGEAAPLPDVLFIDINMPSMDGITFLKSLKSHSALRGIPAIMFSTSAYKKDIDTCYAEGAAGYLVKPSGNKALVEKLEQVLGYWIDTMEPAHG